MRRASKTARNLRQEAPCRRFSHLLELKVQTTASSLLNAF